VLVERLRRFQEDRRFEPEIARRERLETYLNGMLQYASRNHKEIARNAAAERLLGSRFSNLPDGVDLGPGELRIRFSGSADFLVKFGAVVYALNNDFERISEFLDGRNVSRG
jgi:hypothetical protein